MGYLIAGPADSLNMKPGQKITFELLTDNVLAASMDTPVWMNNTLIFDKKRFHYFRDGKAGNKTAYCFIACPPSALTDDDVAAINARFDQNEGAHNRSVKQLIAGSLARHFNGRAFHVYEPGSGQFPLAPWFPAGTNVTYHGIESDPACIAALEEQGFLASSWKEALEAGAPQGKPSVCAAIYALHFMVNEELPAAILRLTSEDGFFVGNYYMHPHEQRAGKERERLAGLLRDSGLESVVLKQAGDPHNEYWIIGRDPEALRAYAADFGGFMRQKNERENAVPRP